MSPADRLTDAQEESSEPFELRAAPGHLVRRLQQVHREIWAREVPGDVTSAQFAVLNILDQKPGIDQRMLGELAGMDRSTTAEIVRRLVARDLLVRFRDAGDARRNLLRVTDAGRALLQRALPAAERVSEQLLLGLGERERVEFVRLLNLVVDHHQVAYD
ncbi:MarR family winged helix-turn-helix transcriptional regulator [Micromonospora sp. NPDC047707]|uniref:MarR family winged helix-turn-helix transcriptional regulator n=1 Tax=Micromonospora sp. NPDC047707 TaxID=3154498 RepID=UPI0034521E4F